MKGEWKTLIEDLRHCEPVSISRSYVQQVKGYVHLSPLTGFCDASMTAYAAVVYLMVNTEMHACMHSLLFARLELLPCSPSPFRD